MPDPMTKLIPRIAVASLSSPLEVGADRAPKLAADLTGLLESRGCEVLNLGPVGNPDQAVAAGRKAAEAHVHAVILTVASWFEDYLALDLLEECPLPVLLWPAPGMETGALCGAQQLTCYLKQLEIPYHSIFAAVEEGEDFASTMEFLHAAALRYRLRRARIGHAGHRVAGMTEVAVNEMALKKTVGPRVVPLDMPELLARAQKTPEDHAIELWRKVTGRAGACRVSDADGIDSMKVYGAIKKLVQEHRLDALTIGCYPHFMGRVCLAASLLADEGVPLGCEGDVNGAVGQLVLQLLTGQPTHNTDWLDPLPDGSVVFTHCGSGSFSLAESKNKITLASVRLMGQGTCALFPARPGPVTLINLVPSGRGYQCALLEGQAVQTEMVFPGNPLRVKFDHSAAHLIQWIHDEGIGHHWMAGYSHQAPAIRHWARLAGSDLVLTEP